MEKTIKYVKELIRHKKVKQISKSLFEVENHSVKIQKRSGATLLLCDCLNHSLKCNSPAFCVHKLSVIIYLSNKDFLERIKKLKHNYERYSELKIPISVDLFLNDLNDIERKW